MTKTLRRTAAGTCLLLLSALSTVVNAAPVVERHDPVRPVPRTVERTRSTATTALANAVTVTVDTIVNLTQGTSTTLTIHIANKQGQNGYYFTGSALTDCRCAGAKRTYTGNLSDFSEASPSSSTTLNQYMTVTVMPTMYPMSYIAWLLVYTNEHDPWGAEILVTDSIRIHLNVAASNPSAPPPAKFLSLADSTVWVNRGMSVPIQLSVANATSVLKKFTLTGDCGISGTCSVPGYGWIPANYSSPVTIGNSSTTTTPDHVVRIIAAKGADSAFGFVPEAFDTIAYNVKYGKAWTTPLALAMDTIVTLTQGTTVTRAVNVGNKGMSWYTGGKYIITENCSGMHCTFTNGTSDTWYDFPSNGTSSRTLSITAPAGILPTSYVAWIGLITEENDGSGGWVDTYDSVRVHINVIASNPSTPSPAGFMTQTDSVLWLNRGIAALPQFTAQNTAATTKHMLFHWECGAYQSACGILYYYASTWMPAGALWQIAGWIGSSANYAPFIARMIGAKGDDASWGMVTEAMDTVTYDIRYGKGWTTPVALAMDTIITITQGTTVTRTLNLANTGVSGNAPGYYTIFMNCAGMRCTTGADGWTDEPARGYSAIRTLSITAPVSILPTSYVGWIGIVTEEQDGFGAYYDTYDSVRVHFNVVAANPAAPPPAKFMTVRDSVIYVSYDSAYGYGRAIVTNQAATSKTVRYSFDCGSNQTCWMNPNPTYLGASSQYSPTFSTHATTTPVNHFAKVFASKGRDSTWGPIAEAMDTVVFDIRYGTTQAPRVLARNATRQVIPFQQVIDSFYVKNKSNDPAAYATTYDLAPHCGRFTGPCYLSASSLTILAGDSTQVFLTYQPDSNVVTSNDVRVRAVRHDNTAEKDSGIVHVSVVDNIAPTITIAGVTSGGMVTTRSAPVTVTICDTDGIVHATSVVFNGTTVGPPMTTATVAGCHSAKSASYLLWLHYGQDTLTVSASDGVHTSTASRIFTYDPASEQRPHVTAMVASGAVPINAAGVDTFVVRNAGSYASTYQLAVSCTGFTAGCSTSSPSVTVAGGSSEKVVISYPYTGTNPTGATVKLKASYVGEFTLLADSATSLLNAMAGTAPAVAITPANGATVTTSTTAVTVSWCSTSALATHDVYVDSLKLADTFQPTTVSGCAVAGTSAWSSVPLKPWTQVISAVAVDAQGRRTSAGNTITYNAPLSAVRPVVSPKNTTATYARTTAATQLFTISNPTAISAPYALSASCGAYPTCVLYRPSVTVAPLSSDTVRVYFTTPSTPETIASIKLAAQYTTPYSTTVADTGLVSVSTPTYATLYQPLVTPVAGDAVYPRAIFSTIYFAVTNMGTDTATYTISTPTFTGGFGLPYSPPPSSVVVAPGATQSLGMGISSPNSEGAQGEVRLTAGVTAGTATVVQSTGVIRLTAREPTYGVRVSPKDFVYRVTPGSSGDLGFSITNTGNGNYAFYYHTVCSGFLTSCPVSGTGVSINVGETVTVPFTFSTRPNYVQGDSTKVRLVVNVGSNDFPAARDTGVIDMPPLGVVLRAVAVTPDSTVLRVAKAVTARYNFTITNRGDDTTTVQYDLSCTGALVSCRLNDTTSSPTHGVTTRLSPGQSATLGAWYTTVDAYGSTGMLTLLARHSADTAVKSIGKLGVLTALIDPVTVATRDQNAGTAVNKGSCLTIAVSDAAAYECGELRVVHGLPSVITMGKARGPTLVYNSRANAPSAMIATDVTLSPGTLADELVATVTVDSAATPVLPSHTYGWNNETFTAGVPRRIVVPIDANAAGLPTDAYHYSLQVGTRQGGSITHTNVDTGTVVIVNRTNSPFGAGWWLDGLEQLIHINDLQMLWVGGDGSTRLYRRPSTGTSVFLVTPAVDRPDTLSVSGSGYTRRLRNGASVVFNAGGYHTQTVSVLGETTAFHWTGSLLDSINVPGPAGTSARRFTFTYANDNAGTPRLTQVRAPNGSASDQLTTITTNPYGTITSIRSLDASDVATSTVAFGYSPSVTESAGALARRMVSRTNSLQHTSYFHYDLGGGLDSAWTDMSGSDPVIKHFFCPAETRSLTSCSGGPEALANVETRWDGPRTDSADVTSVVVNRFGAPTRIRNAYGHETTVEYDSRWPLLPRRTAEAGGLETIVTYDPLRALATTVTVLHPHTPSDATTTYQWHDTLDVPVSVQDPAGIVTTRRYDTPTRTLTWVQTAGDTTAFTYFSNKQVQTVVSRADTSTESFTYDSLGNVASHTLPLSGTTVIVRDASGREHIVTTPVGGAIASQQRLTFYDNASRDTLQVTLAGTDTLTIRKRYDAQHQLLSLSQSGSANANGIGAVTHTFQYDWAGRQVGDSLSGASVVRSTFDAAGNLIAGGRTPLAKTTVYDRLNRPVASSGAYAYATFSYDSLGRLRTANNPFAKVTRDYDLGGAITTETVQIASVDAQPNSTTNDFSLHQYVTSYMYDASGRRVRMTSPAVLGGGTTQYAYSSPTGAVSSIVNSASGQSRYHYDRLGRLDTLVRRAGQADSIPETWVYDKQGRVTTRRLRFAGTEPDTYGLTYDSLSRIVHASGTDTVEYDPMGHVTYARTAGGTERMTVDELGNRVSKVSVVQHGGGGTDHYKYTPGTGRLQWVNRSGTSVGDTTFYRTDFLGNTYEEAHAIWRYVYSGSATGDGHLEDFSSGWSLTQLNIGGSSPAAYGTLHRDHNQTTFQFDDDNHVIGSIFVIDSLYGAQTYPYGPVTYTDTEAYRYDALGRRIWIRTQRDSACRLVHGTNDCQSQVTRVLWDGEQIAGEIRAPLSLYAYGDNDAETGPYAGVVTYTHGGGIDHPLAVHKAGALGVYPITDWHGSIGTGICQGGSNLAARCVSTEVRFPLRAQGIFGAAGSTSANGPPSWYGSLIEGMRDGSGKVYQRNRYLDPETGRFTQEDPIGLAGGMNLYGFGGGDPVNFSDPFGLCPDKNDPKCERVYFAGVNVNAIFATGGTGAVGIFVSGAGVGLYARGGAGFGVDINAGLEFGTSTNLNAMRGGSVGQCVGGGPGVVGGGVCGSINADGSTISVGPSIGTKSIPGVLSTHAEITTTKAATFREMYDAAVQQARNSGGSTNSCQKTHTAACDH